MAARREVVKLVSEDEEEAVTVNLQILFLKRRLCANRNRHSLPAEPFNDTEKERCDFTEAEVVGNNMLILRRKRICFIFSV